MSPDREYASDSTLQLTNDELVSLALEWAREHGVVGRRLLLTLSRRIEKLAERCARAETEVVEMRSQCSEYNGSEGVVCTLTRGHPGWHISQSHGCPVALWAGSKIVRLTPDGVRR